MLMLYNGYEEKVKTSQPVQIKTKQKVNNHC